MLFMVSVLLTAVILAQSCGYGGSDRLETTPTPTPSNEAGENEDETTKSEDIMTKVTGSGAVGDFYIDAYEASVVDGKAISKPNVIPRVSIDFAGAKAACAASKKRLCQYKEWVLACKGPDGLLFGFQEAHDSPLQLKETCDVARTSNNTPGSLPSKAGAHASCKTKDLKIYDMIGNATEWAMQADDEQVAAGAAFYQPESQSHCDATLTDIGSTDPMPATEKSTDLGFRCCRDID